MDCWGSGCGFCGDGYPLQVPAIYPPNFEIKTQVHKLKITINFDSWGWCAEYWDSLSQYSHMLFSTLNLAQCLKHTSNTLSAPQTPWTQDQCFEPTLNTFTQAPPLTKGCGLTFFNFWTEISPPDQCSKQWNLPIFMNTNFSPLVRCSWCMFKLSCWNGTFTVFGANSNLDPPFQHVWGMLFQIHLALDIP